MSLQSEIINPRIMRIERVPLPKDLFAHVRHSCLPAVMITFFSNHGTSESLCFLASCFAAMLLVRLAKMASNLFCELPNNLDAPQDDFIIDSLCEQDEDDNYELSEFGNGENSPIVDTELRSTKTLLAKVLMAYSQKSARCERLITENACIETKLQVAELRNGELNNLLEQITMSSAALVHKWETIACDSNTSRIQLVDQLEHETSLRIHAEKMLVEQTVRFDAESVEMNARMELTNTALAMIRSSEAQAQEEILRLQAVIQSLEHQLEEASRLQTTPIVCDVILSPEEDDDDVEQSSFTSIAENEVLDQVSVLEDNVNSDVDPYVIGGVQFISRSNHDDDPFESPSSYVDNPHLIGAIQFIRREVSDDASFECPTDPYSYCDRATAAVDPSLIGGIQFVSCPTSREDSSDIEITSKDDGAFGNHLEDPQLIGAIQFISREDSEDAYVESYSDFGTPVDPSLIGGIQFVSRRPISSEDSVDVEITSKDDGTPDNHLDDPQLIGAIQFISRKDSEDAHVESYSDFGTPIDPSLIGGIQFVRRPTTSDDCSDIDTSAQDDETSNNYHLYGGVQFINHVQYVDDTIEDIAAIEVIEGPELSDNELIAVGTGLGFAFDDAADEFKFTSSASNQHLVLDSKKMRALIGFVQSLTAANLFSSYDELYERLLEVESLVSRNSEKWLEMACGIYHEDTGLYSISYLPNVRFPHACQVQWQIVKLWKQVGATLAMVMQYDPRHQFCAGMTIDSLECYFAISIKSKWNEIALDLTCASKLEKVFSHHLSMSPHGPVGIAIRSCLDQALLELHEVKKARMMKKDHAMLVDRPAEHVHDGRIQFISPKPVTDYDNENPVDMPIEVIVGPELTYDELVSVGTGAGFEFIEAYEEFVFTSASGYRMVLNSQEMRTYVALLQSLSADGLFKSYEEVCERLCEMEVLASGYSDNWLEMACGSYEDNTSLYRVSYLPKMRFNHECQVRWQIVKIYMEIAYALNTIMKNDSRQQLGVGIIVDDRTGNFAISIMAARDDEVILDLATASKFFDIFLKYVNDLVANGPEGSSVRSCLDRTLGELYDPNAGFEEAKSPPSIEDNVKLSPEEEKQATMTLIWAERMVRQAALCDPKNKGRH